MSSARIERIAFPNMIKTTLVKDNLKDVNAIAVDQELDLLIWSDSKSKSIEYSNIHGLSRRTLYQEPDMHPISMAVYSKFLFWIEKDKKTIEKLPLDLDVGNNKQTVFSKLMHLTDIISVPRMNKNSSSLLCTVSIELIFFRKSPCVLLYAKKLDYVRMDIRVKRLNPKLTIGF